MPDLGFPRQSRTPAPLLVHSVPLRSLPSPHHYLSSATFRSTLLWRWGQALAFGVDTEQSGWCSLHLARRAHRADRASYPVLESPARETAPSCRRQRAPATRKPGVCRRRIGEGGFHGPTSFLTLEEGALGLFVLRRKSPWDTNCHFPRPPSPRRRLN